MLIALLLSVAFAATPTFDGNRKVVELADQMWTVATKCAGRPARAHRTVAIRRQRDPRVFVRFDLTSDARGLSRIDINRGDSPFHLANAIAAAWFPEGDLALRVAMTELLTECVARLTLEDVPYTRRDLMPVDTLDDLLDWTDEIDERLLDINPDLIVELSERELKAHYAASWRLGLLLGEVLPAFANYDRRLLTWPALFDALAKVERGRAVIDMLKGGEDAQRVALADPDQDGQLSIQEAWAGTDPLRWDTDGDGWWDGYDERPEGAVPVARDGSPSCLNEVPRTGSTTIELGGRMRGAILDEITVTNIDPAELWPIPEDLIPGRGGHWIRAVGEDLVPNPHCHWTPRATARVVPPIVLDPILQLDVGPRIRAVDPVPLRGVTAEQLRAFTAALTEADARYEAELGRARWRIHVELGQGEHIRAYRVRRAPQTMVSTKLSKRMLGSDSLRTSTASIAVAMQRLSGRSAGAAHPATALLYARDSLGQSVPNLVGILPDEVAVVRRQFERECAEGWPDVFDRYCLDRLYNETLD